MGWAHMYSHVRGSDQVFMDMYTEDAWFRLFPSDMWMTLNKAKPGYTCDVLYHWINTGEWVWSDKANQQWNSLIVRNHQ